MPLPAPPRLSEPARRNARSTILSTARALAAAVLLTAAYFVLPLNRLSGAADGVTLAVALGVLAVVVGFQLVAVMRSPTPAARAVAALSLTIPLFLYLFAAAYYVISVSDATKFSQPSLTRLDALYFTVTVFSTVGFGDIAPTAQSTRLLVTIQIVLDLVLIGVVIRVFAAAVERARRRAQADAAEQA